MPELGDIAAVALVPTPAAGAEWSVVVPNGSVWDVLTARAVLNTSAVVANRNVRVTVSDGTTELGRVGAAVAQPASIVGVHSFGLQDAPDFAGAGGLTFNHPLPATRVVGNGVIASLTQNLDVGDQWSGIALQVMEWNLTAIVQASEWYGRKQWPT
jgi:hypothetical protein